MTLDKIETFECPMDMSMLVISLIFFSDHIGLNLMPGQKGHIFY